MPTNIPTDLLRAFVTVIDLGGYTRAAEALGRTQPAISQKLRRLEAIIGQPLLLAEAGQIRLTDAARTLDTLARQMLRINDDIAASFADERLSGWLRVGVPTDFSNAFMLQAIADFAAAHRGVRIEVSSRASRDLRTALAAEELDMIFAIAPEDGMPWLVQSFRVTPFWAISAAVQLDPAAPVPLLRHPDPCEYADRMRSALRDAGRPWRTLLVCNDVEGLVAAVRAGLGVTALTPATLAAGLRRADVGDGLPPLAPLRIGLFYKHARLSRAGHGLAQSLLARLI
ncbi:DNA-binding transcriptional regulator, LysR family [Gemmobacter aquatilis]|uniref:DNA-binding transcriptional regulator, LysR family n=1 Tax=Gemmobacter aquatilis TaxID=933059 RepID=A0A1H8GR01_9RHOB|nr:LysR substrate-binding domain-containing protein [Gemmobacter aquatilis]SEN46239.1 DNA-binding transcriptional regulator, LysR family [Gemmobacter aquatilis]